MIQSISQSNHIPDLPHSISNLSNSHSLSCSIHDILLRTNTRALLLHLSLPRLWLSSLALALHSKLQHFQGWIQLKIFPWYAPSKNVWKAMPGNAISSVLRVKFVFWWDLTFVYYTLLYCNAKLFSGKNLTVAGAMFVSALIHSWLLSKHAHHPTSTHACTISRHLPLPSKLTAWTFPVYWKFEVVLLKSQLVHWNNFVNKRDKAAE